jgi:hypothetical protein
VSNVFKPGDRIVWYDKEFETATGGTVVSHNRIGEVDKVDDESPRVWAVWDDEDDNVPRYIDLDGEHIVIPEAEWELVCNLKGV